CGVVIVFFFFQAEDGIRDRNVTGVQTCALPISALGDPVARVWNIAAAGEMMVAFQRNNGFFTGASFSINNQYIFTSSTDNLTQRSEERRVGKECRSGW